MREYFINADFDLSLRRGRPEGADDARARLAGELAFHMLLLGIEGDSVLAPDELQAEFAGYLDRVQVPVPDVRVVPSVTPHARFTPFGWNDEAERLNLRYDEPAPHPPLSVVRRVNGRSFSADIERRHWGGAFFRGLVRSADELSDVLRSRAPEDTGWVVKSEHGNGAFGNRRLRSPRLSDGDLKAVALMFDEDECAVVEPWRERVLDLASVFDVNRQGQAVGLETHEVLNAADGAFIGDVFDSGDPALARWKADLETMADIVARELSGSGYVGPVCVDSFVWSDRGVARFRPVVDINARLFMAAAAARLWRRWGRERVVCWRLFSRRRLRLPEAFEDFEQVLADAAFRPDTGCGILVTSPLNVGGVPLTRIGVVFAGRDRRSVDDLDRCFRGRFEK